MREHPRSLVIQKDLEKALSSARKVVLRQMKVFPNLSPELEEEVSRCFVQEVSSRTEVDRTNRLTKAEPGLCSDVVQVAAALYFLDAGVREHYRHLDIGEAGLSEGSQDLRLAIGDLYYANAMVAVAPVGNVNIVERSARAIRDIAKFYDSAEPAGPGDISPARTILLKLAKALSHEVNTKGART